MSTLKDTFIFELIKFNLNIRYKSNTLFTNLSRDFIKRKYLTNVSKLKLNIDDANIIYITLDNAYEYTINYLNSFTNIEDLINTINCETYPDVSFNLPEDSYLFYNSLTLGHLLKIIFSKGTQRLLYFYNYLDGKDINGDDLEEWSELNSYDKTKILMTFIIVNQIFGDGNHRTSKLVHKYYNIDLYDYDFNSIIHKANFIIDKHARMLPISFPIILENHDDKKSRECFYKAWKTLIINNIYK